MEHMRRSRHRAHGMAALLRCGRLLIRREFALMTPLRLLHFTDLHLSADESGACCAASGRWRRCGRPWRRRWPTPRRAAGRRMRSWSPAMWCTTIRAVTSCSAGSSPASACRCAAFPATTMTPAALARALTQPPFITRGTFDLRGWRLVLLDTSVLGQDGGHLAPAQLQLLEQALASGHHAGAGVSASSSGAHVQRLAGPDRPGQCRGVLSHHRRAPLRCAAILWGHVHQSFDGLRRGVRLLATPSTCAPVPAAFARLRHRPAAAGLSHAGACGRRQPRHGSLLGGLMRHWLLALCLLGSLTARAQSPVWALHGRTTRCIWPSRCICSNPATARCPRRSRAPTMIPANW